MDWRPLLALYWLPGLISAQQLGTISLAHKGSTLPTRSISTGSGPSPSPGFCTSNSPDCCGPRTIESTGQLETLSKCSVFQGDLVLRRLAAPPSTGRESLLPINIDLSAIENGSLEVLEVHHAISMNNLTTVSGDISFTLVTNLQTSLFPSLTAAASINFEAVKFSGPYTEGAGSAIDITWSSDTNAPMLQSVKSISFNNTNVNVIALSNSQLLDVSINGNPELISVDLTGVDSLENASISNNLLTSLDLSNVDSMTLLDVTNNTGLVNLSLSTLATVDKLIITGNPRLQNVTLPDLGHVSNSLYINGPINNLNFSPALTSVAGNITVVSSGDYNCGPIREIVADGHPAYCTHTAQSSATSPSSSVSGSTPTTSSTSSSSSTGTHSSSGLSSGATIGIGVGVGVGGALVLALVLFFCWRSRRSKDSHAVRSVSKERSGYSGKGDYYTYREVPYEASGASGAKQLREEPRSEDHASSSLVGMADAWVPPESAVAATEGRTELEEQQGPRHEMDARSIDFSDDDEQAETRSLEDIERVHRQQ